MLGASENFGVDWIEHNDPENKLVVSGTNNETLTWTNVNRSDSCFYNKNQTEADYEIWFDFNISEAEAGDVDLRQWLILWRGSITNLTLYGWSTEIVLRQDSTNDNYYDLLFRQYEGGWDFQLLTTTALDVGSVYYANVSQSGTTYYCDIYSTWTLRNEDGGGDVWDVQGDAGNDHTYHWWFVVVGPNVAPDAGDWTSGYITEFDFTPIQSVADIAEPHYHYPFGLNSTLNGSICQFTVNFSDNTGLTNAYLSWNNSGSWANVSYTLTGTVDLALWNQTLNATSGLRIEYLFYVNDTSNNWNTTLQHFIYTNTKPLVLVVSDAGVLFIGFILVFSLLGSIFILGRRKT